MRLSSLSVFSALRVALLLLKSDCSVDTVQFDAYEAVRYQTLKQALEFVPGDLSTPNTLSDLSMFRLTRDISKDYIADPNVFAGLLANPRKEIRLNLGDDFKKYMLNAAFRATVDDLVDKPLEQVWSDVEKLWLSHTKVTDISSLAGLKNLKELDLSYTQVTDISSLAGLKNLEELNLRHTQVTDISPLAGLKNLWDLDLSSSRVTVISSLAELKNLKVLYLSDTQITDISPLTAIDTLETLYLHWSPVTDISSLDHLRGLTIRQ